MGTLPRVHHLNLSFSHAHLLFFLFLSLTTITPSSSRHQIIIPPYSIPSRISYPQHCSQIVPESTPTGNPFSTNHVPTFSGAYVTNGDQIVGSSSQVTANLTPRNVFKTVDPGVYKIDASLVVRVSGVRRRRNLLNVYGVPRFPVAPRSMRFFISGFWNSASGQLCMVGFGKRRLPTGKSLDFDVVFKSNYPSSTVITSSLVTGTLESLNLEGSDSHFSPISIMSFAKANYEYTLIREEIDSGFELGSNTLSNVSMFDLGAFSNCYYFASLSDNFELTYMSSCNGRNCSQFDAVLEFLPRFMSMNEIDCSDHRMIRVAIGFSDSSDIRNGYRQPLNPSTALVAEGSWNAENNQLCFIACRILNFTESPLSASVGDCSIRVNFSFPAFLTIRTPSVINGHIWSNKSVDEPGYFDRSEIRASGYLRSALPGMKYNYTEIERSKKYCSEKKDFKLKGKSYPDPYFQDLKFDMDVKNGKGQLAWGRSHPVFVDNTFFQDTYPNVHSLVNNSYIGLLNLTYQLTFSPIGDFNVGGQSFLKNRTTVISAEGTYDTETGHICMVGCWNREIDEDMPLNTSKLDCDIFINIQIPPRDSNGGDVVKGTIESKRAKSDPLYFDPLELSPTSLTKTQIGNAFWTMDFEITMVLISNTLTCIFVGLQLFHVKRHPDILPFISLVMMIIITLGHMIPLLLNMEAFFLSSPSKRTMLFGNGGWLEVNEVLVRFITMLAFLLEFRLLQLTWYARGSDEGRTSKPLWVSEKEVIWYSLPLYAGGALIAWFVQRLRGPESRFRHIIPSSNPSLPFWGDVKSYAGFVLDAFLLPQIMFNVFSDSKDSALCLPYYLGTTIVRLLPHGYDLFRAHSPAWRYDPWYIYANPGMNYYSTTWDILICCVGILFVIAIYLQQRFGGRTVLPRRFRKNVAYEQVPVGL